MIEIGSAGGGVDPAVLRSPGGFLWWYVDVVTPRGDGAVLIWSWGLPFLPGYAASARAGSAQHPADRPSVNLAVYRGGRPDFYLLQELPADAADPSSPEACQRLGGCTFARAVSDGRLTLDAALDCALPGGLGRLTGTLRLEGVARSVEAAPAPAGDAPPHVWTALTGPATASLELAVGGRPFASIAGRAYHDRNAGRVPLHGLGIGRWMWGRFPFADREAIYYLNWPSDPAAAPVLLGVEIDAAGRTAVFPVEAALGPERAAFPGVTRPETIVLRRDGAEWLRVRHTVVGDAGPFYLRLLSEGVSGGETATGWSELCLPDRVDLARHRPFVRMRVHRAAGPNSRFLPWFTGPRAGRMARAVRGFLGLAR